MFDLLFIYIVVADKRLGRSQKENVDQPQNVKHPQNLDDLIDIMTIAAANHKHVKGVSTRYSAEWNNIAATDGCLINTATYANFQMLITVIHTCIYNNSNNNNNNNNNNHNNNNNDNDNF